ncbi:DUF3164 family protein [Agrobacterium tumefaciens]|uniref:DUF3164 family protein n=1 Tax=Agrobacterium tumefaciens TaxID=358 RepID=UPI0008100EBB|nr:DUF3164 family protein [Agrobacterium tumefaciens]NSL22399.1 DUF3164 family protein [Agrobacterium tumefaciens]NTC57214.1 DUF3164 family protein [Agrobacterium tumefaciens]NTC62132.1 DUF3164 family protein [Agrobacterium tumefaciens]NTC65862.1 DUF3164 family protein [Agrobacterium tumefaciens]NTC74442.1 DUF3164 family protein [Agrobacterium tumefaciens]
MQSVNLEEHSKPGVVIVSGREFMHNAKGGLDPVGNVKDQYKLEDQTVRKCIEFALNLNAQLSRFRGHTAADLSALDALLGEKYNVTIGGKKGNRTYQTYDGLMKIQVQVSDLITFGPELQVAKQLIDACLVEWSADSRPEIQSIVTRAFNTEKEGQVNRADVFMLLKLEIDDARWKTAMEAIRDAIRVTGSKEYVRFYKRDSLEADWQAITIDLAKA